MTSANYGNGDGWKISSRRTFQQEYSKETEGGTDKMTHLLPCHWQKTTSEHALTHTDTHMVLNSFSRAVFWPAV